MDKVITESGMDFISTNTYHIEQSRLYASLGEDVRSVEFIRAKDDALLFVEAKTTFSNPENSEENFQTQINDICDKFIHSLNLYSSIKVGVNEETFDIGFAPPEKISLIFVLVIKTHEKRWCRPIQQKLVSTLLSYLKRIWKPEIYVLNHEAATNKKLTTL